MVPSVEERFVITYPPKLTVLAFVVKPLPEIVIGVAGGPDEGESAESAGGWEQDGATGFSNELINSLVAVSRKP